MLKLFKLNKLRKRISTPAEIIQQEQSNIEELFSGFTKLHNDVSESISKIKDAKEEAFKRRDSYLAKVKNEENTINLADAEVQANEGLLKKIEEFIPTKGE